MRGQPAPLLPAVPGPSLPPPSPVLLRQLHHHGRQLIQHEDSGKPLVAHQPVGDLLVSGHRELVCPQHLGQDGSLGRPESVTRLPAPSPLRLLLPLSVAPGLCEREIKAPGCQ